MEKHHVTLRIQRALQLTDKELEDMFSKPANELRAGFKEGLEAGHVYIGSEGCNGFDPIKGCPGHAN